MMKMSAGLRSKVVPMLLLCLAWTARTQIVSVLLDREATLAGVVREIHGHGPPGYGEDKRRDARITYWVLDVPTLVNAPCTPEKPEWTSDCKPTKRIRLFFPTLPLNNGLEFKAKKMGGKKLLVTGVLHRQDTLGQITWIYMDVPDLEPSQPNPGK